jgi:hypothetical protein
MLPQRSTKIARRALARPSLCATIVEIVRSLRRIFGFGFRVRISDFRRAGLCSLRSFVAVRLCLAALGFSVVQLLFSESFHPVDFKPKEPLPIRGIIPAESGWLPGLLRIHARLKLDFHWVGLGKLNNSLSGENFRGAGYVDCADGHARNPNHLSITRKQLECCGSHHDWQACAGKTGHPEPSGRVAAVQSAVVVAHRHVSEVHFELDCIVERSPTDGLRKSDTNIRLDTIEVQDLRSLVGGELNPRAFRCQSNVHRYPTDRISSRANRLLCHSQGKHICAGTNGAE